MSKCFKDFYIQKLKHVELSVEQKEYFQPAVHTTFNYKQGVSEI